MNHPAAIPESIRTTDAAQAWRQPARVTHALAYPWVSPVDVPPQADGLYLAMYVEPKQTGSHMLPIDELIFGDYAVGHLNPRDAIADEEAVIERGWFQDHHMTGHPIPRQVVAYIPIDMSATAPSMAAMRERLLALMAEG